MTSKASTGSSDRGGADDGAVRCGCGSLVARRTPRGIEIKCRRCKRIMVMPMKA